VFIIRVQGQHDRLEPEKANLMSRVAHDRDHEHRAVV